MDITFEQGSTYIINYKSGRYIAEFVEKSLNGPKVVVKILSVLEHPEQGDLHHPYQADVFMFHQRKASAYLEHVLVPIQQLEKYDGETIDYRVSLSDAYQRKLSELSARTDAWSVKAKEQLLLVGTEYGFN